MAGVSGGVLLRKSEPSQEGDSNDELHGAKGMVLHQLSCSVVRCVSRLLVSYFKSRASKDWSAWTRE
jgi:hypothetical protein